MDTDVKQLFDKFLEDVKLEIMDYQSKIIPLLELAFMAGYENGYGDGYEDRVDEEN